METKTSRRALLGAIAVAPAALAVNPAAAASGAPVDPAWPSLVADYYSKYAAWLTTVDLQEDAGSAFSRACASLPTEPSTPGSGLPDDFQDMTLRQIRATGATQEHKSAWADYERDHAVWEAQRDALRKEVVGPAEAAYKQAYAVQADALNALAAHRVTNLRDLGEKIEIIAKDHDGCDIPPQYMAEVLADVHHLMGHRSSLPGAGNVGVEA